MSSPLASTRAWTFRRLAPNWMIFASFRVIAISPTQLSVALTMDQTRGAHIARIDHPPLTNL